MRLHLYTVLFEHSLVPYAPYCVCVGREDSDETVLVQFPLSLRWSHMLHIFVDVSRGDSDETSLAHSLL